MTEGAPPYESEPQQPQLPNLCELARQLGFEPNHSELIAIGQDILSDQLRDEEEIKRLIGLYHEKAYALMVEQNKRNATDNLALILQLAHFHYLKEMYSAVLNDLKDMNEAFQSPEIDDDTYELIGTAMAALRVEIAKQTS